MKTLILGILFSTFVNIISIKAQPLKISTVTFGNKKENKISEINSLKKQDFITEEQDIHESLKAERREEKKYNNVYRKEIRQTRRLSRKYESNHGLNAGRHKEKIGL